MYLHARYYDPKLGFFLSPDPIGPAGGTNLYGYGLGDPVNGTDRSGTEVCFVNTPSTTAGGTTDANYHSPQAPQVECVGGGPYQGGTELAMGEARYAQNLALSGNGGVYAYEDSEGHTRFTMNPGNTANGSTSGYEEFVHLESGVALSVQAPRQMARVAEVPVVVNGTMYNMGTEALPAGTVEQGNFAFGGLLLTAGTLAWGVPALELAATTNLRELRLDGPAAGAQYLNGRIVGLRYGDGVLLRLDVHPREGGAADPILHLHVLPWVPTEHGLVIPLWRFNR
jgi:hypothetical protein